MPPDMWGPRLKWMNRVAQKLESRPPSSGYRPPLEGRWKVLIDKTHHHRSTLNMLNALDLQAVDERGRAYKADPRVLSNWYSFGKPVYAIAGGSVQNANGEEPDAPVGKLGKKTNAVSIVHPNGEVSNYTHLKQGSVTVKKGDQVEAGQMIGRVGNSGQAVIPHLHFSIFVSRVKELPITRDLDHQADNLFASIPVYWEDFRLVRVGRIKCNVHVIRGRPQENWIMEFNELKEESAR